MSSDQKPAKARIVVNAPSSGNTASPPPAVLAETASNRPGDAKPKKPPVLLLSCIFLVTCAAAGAGVALLPWLSR
jgi:hypothetical protein